MPNYAEKLAATYFRLNGFLLLPQFTIFPIPGAAQKWRHRHLDLIGFRVGGSEEKIGVVPVWVDPELFGAISELPGYAEAKEKTLPIAVQVKTNGERSSWPNGYEEYLSTFLGSRPISIEVRSQRKAFAEKDGRLVIGLSHMLGAIHERVRWMKEYHKLESWAWSEDFLADFLSHSRLESSREPKHRRNVRAE